MVLSVSSIFYSLSAVRTQGIPLFWVLHSLPDNFYFTVAPATFPPAIWTVTFCIWYSRPALVVAIEALIGASFVVEPGKLFDTVIIADKVPLDFVATVNTL